MDRNSLNHSKPNISELFTNKKYKVPKYQRAFSWNKEKAEQFFTDIFSKKNDDYFLGSILLNKKDDVYEIIDGQQRLTTISLFFLAFYFIYKKNISIEDAQKYIHPYLRCGDLLGQYNVLELSRHNNDFYDSLIKCNSEEELNILDPKDSNKNILDILKFFIEQISKERVEDIHLEKIRLNDFLRHFTNNVFFIELVVSNHKQASKLFEVLNNRGTDLTEADLVRNYLLSELERQKLNDEQSIQDWEQIESQIELKNLEKFFRYSSLLVSRQDDIYSRVVDFTEKTSSKSVIQEMKKFADFYMIIEEPENNDESPESGLLQELNIIGATQVRSVLLAAYYKFSQDEIVELVKFLVSFVFQYSIVGKNPNKVETKYAEIAYKIYNEGLNIENVKNELKDKSICPTSTEFSEAFVNKQFKTTKLPRYIIGKIENHVSSQEKKVDFLTIDLEHIMPKKITKWIDIDKNYHATHKEYLDNIGNMVILSKKINSSIKNDIFQTKKDKYDDSEINLIKDIKLKDRWGEDEIKWNAKRYLESAKIIWKI